MVTFFGLVFAQHEVLYKLHFTNFILIVFLIQKPVGYRSCERVPSEIFFDKCDTGIMFDKLF